MCGQVTLVVPQGSEVELDGVRPILGEVKHTRAGEKIRTFVRRVLTGDEPERGPRREGEPLVFIVTGRAICGSVTVVSR